MKKCEERQEKILQYMKDTIRERCFPPTVREICAALDIKSTSTVFKDLKVLEEKGMRSAVIEGQKACVRKAREL